MYTFAHQPHSLARAMNAGGATLPGRRHTRQRAAAAHIEETSTGIARYVSFFFVALVPSYRDTTVRANIDTPRSTHTSTCTRTHTHTSTRIGCKNAPFERPRLLAPLGDNLYHNRDANSGSSYR